MVASTTSKKTQPEPETEYDFDNWSPEDEEKALAALVPQIKHIIVEKQFIGRFPDGVIVKLPLTLSLDDVDALQAEASSPVDQFKSLLERLAGTEVAAEFSRHDLTETVVMAERFFTIFERVAKASLPE